MLLSPILQTMAFRKPTLCKFLKTVYLMYLKTLMPSILIVNLLRNPNTLLYLNSHALSQCP